MKLTNQEIEQLQAQNGAMRGILEQIIWKEKKSGWAPMAKYVLSLTNIPEYHNPTDAETLIQAKEALYGGLDYIHVIKDGYHIEASNYSEVTSKINVALDALAAIEVEK